MKDYKNIHLKTISVQPNTKEIVHQSTIGINKHYPKKNYLILSKNDFGKNKRLNVGIFNKKTNFIISNENSIYMLDEDGNLHVPKIDEIINKKLDKEQYLLYGIPCFNMDTISEINLNINDEKVKIKLDFFLGLELYNYILNPDIDIEETHKYLFELIINKEEIENEVKIDINKTFLINSNPFFLIGFLFNFYNEKMSLTIKTDKNYTFNIYIFTAILNILGASYSIRFDKEINDFLIRFKLPVLFKYLLKSFLKDKIESVKNTFYYKLIKYFENENINFNESKKIINNKFKMFRNFKYSIFDKVKIINYKDFANYLDNLDNDKSSNILEFYINSGIIELIPIKDLKFIEINEPVKAYDFITEGFEDSTNYILPGTPLMKNSDGDILAVMGVWTEDAAKEADEKFGITIKQNLLNPLTGNVNQWIGIDSILGLYNFTN